MNFSSFINMILETVNKANHKKKISLISFCIKFIFDNRGKKTIPFRLGTPELLRGESSGYGKQLVPASCPYL